MALRGNLRDFSLPDVFQLVQLSGKTGVLRISGPETEGSIWFRDGEVFFAQSNWRREQLGERLVAAQRITPAALARALDLRTTEPEGGRRLGEILVNEGYITQQVLETFVQEQIQDTIFDIMRWDEGDFDFEVLPSVVNEDIGLSVSVENIVMEGSRRLEEWQRIKKKVPSTDMVFKMATAPGEGTFEISLKPVEWALLLLIDGTRSVRELAVETHSTDFDVARVVYGLFSAGLLEVPTDEEIEKLRADRSRREDKRARLESERAAREQVQMDEALDLEAQLAARAEARRVAAEPAETAAGESVVEPETQPEPQAELEAASETESPRHEPEEPEFLAAAGETPSPDDMAVFEQMMASVLSPQAPEPEIGLEGETPEQAAAPTVISDESDDADEEPQIVSGLDFMSELAPELGLIVEPEGAAGPGLEDAAELPAEFVPGVDFFPEAIASEFESDAPAAPAHDTLVPSAPAFEQEIVAGGEQEVQSGAEYVSYPATFELEAGLPGGEPEGVAKTGDFEVDLRSLGLGEYPEELLQGSAAEKELPAPSEPDTSGMAADFAEFSPGSDLLEPVAEGSSDFSVPETEDHQPPAETRLPMSEIEAGRADTQPPSGPDEDLDSLLASLGSDDAESGGAAAGVISSGMDFGTEEAADGGYISTDAFLAEFDGSSLSSGLGDELTALTGGAMTRSRPVATVNKLPEVGENQILHRDQMVDRTLLEKIIEGIENL